MIELVKEIVTDYFNVCNCEPINLSIVFSDNIWEKYWSIPVVELYWLLIKSTCSGNSVLTMYGICARSVILSK